MASGNYARKSLPRVPIEPATIIPARATRKLETIVVQEEEPETNPVSLRSTVTKALTATKALQIAQPPIEKKVEPFEPFKPVRPRRIVDADAPYPPKHHNPWLKPVILCMVSAVVFAGVLLSAAMMQRPGSPQLVNFTGGQVYSIQVGGADAKSWQSNNPQPPKTAIPTRTGPYAVLGKPTITPDFINRVLASYNSPAAGKGQKLYDLGVKYGIDPAFALAFFLHESTMGTAGEARTTMSLGNLRCIPDHPCVDKERGGYAQMESWEDGFETWYQLIRNYYIARRGLITVDQIIPTYAPNADNNNEAAYIASLKRSIDIWHAGNLRP